MNMMQTLHKLPLLARVVALYCAVLLPIWGASQVHRQQIVASVAEVRASLPVIQVAKKPAIITGTPKELEISRLKIKLAVNNGTYDVKTASWSLSDTAAQFATMTTKPNDRSGLSVIYGHNTVQVLEPTKDLVEGDILRVKTTNGHILTYIYDHDKKVAPNDTSVLDQKSDEPRLVLLTCEGVWSLQRRLMYFNFVEAR